MISRISHLAYSIVKYNFMKFNFVQILTIAEKAPKKILHIAFVWIAQFFLQKRTADGRLIS